MCCSQVYTSWLMARVAVTITIRYAAAPCLCKSRLILGSRAFGRTADKDVSLNASSTSALVKVIHSIILYWARIFYYTTPPNLGKTTSINNIPHGYNFFTCLWFYLSYVTCQQLFASSVLKNSRRIITNALNLNENPACSSRRSLNVSAMEIQTGIS